MYFLIAGFLVAYFGSFCLAKTLVYPVSQIEWKRILGWKNSF